MGNDSIFKTLYILKRLTDGWGDYHLEAKNSSLKMSYMPVFLSITTEGISNNDVAKQLHITKMASSKVIKELSSLGLIYGAKDEKDRRSEYLFLTQEGEKVKANVKELSGQLIKEYEELLGKDGFSKLMKNLQTLQAYHEKFIKT